MNTQFVTELFSEYQERKSRNASYSERAFARAVGLSPGFLKLLFQNKRRISAARAREVAQRLCWSECKISALSALSKVDKGSQRVEGFDFFEISDWYHFALIELLKTEPRGLKKPEICRRLGISNDEANYSLTKLSQLKMIEIEEGRAKALVGNYEVPAMTSDAIRKFHRQTLNKAIEALDQQAYERKEFKALSLAFDPARMEEVEKYLARFIQAFESKFGSGNLTAVYQLNLAFFQLDKEKPK